MPKRKYVEGKIFPSNKWGDIEIMEYVDGKHVKVKFLNSGYEYWTSVTRIVLGEVKDITQSFIFGVGLVDVNYSCEKSMPDGTRVVCPFYRCWKNMLQRCYYNPEPSYIGCSVTPEWHKLSMFKAWMETQDWQNKELDKDLLVKGNKIYGPDTCMFLPREVNAFIVDKVVSRISSSMLPGVNKRNDNIFIAQCGQGKNPVGYLGSFRTEIEAHEAWREHKLKLAKELGERVGCNKISEALVKRYS